MIEKIRRVTRDGRWIPEIDGLRFIAIFSVLLFHLGGEVQMRSGRIISIEPRYDWLSRILGNGDRGVRLFFVISGMILALPFARQYLKGAKAVSLRKYYLRRVTRLEPPYMLSMVLLLLMIAVYGHGHLVPHFWPHALASLFYLHNLAYGDLSWVNAVTWSLEVEIQFYVLAPLAMLLFKLRGTPHRRAVMLLLILGAGALQASIPLTPRLVLSIFYYVQYFLMGLFLADIFTLDLERMRTHWLWDVAGAAGLAYMFWSWHDSMWAHALLPFAVGLVILGAMRSIVLRRFVANPWVAVIGGMCYSIYLLHFATMAALFKVSRRLLSTRMDFAGNYVVQLVVMGPLIVLVAMIFYLLVERPCMDPDWPSKLWRKLTGRSGAEVEALDAHGIAEDGAR